MKNKTSPTKKLMAITAVLALSLTACSSNSASPAPTSSVAGPSAWTAEQKQYLDAIHGADLASSTYLSATDYIAIGKTVCDGLKQSMPLEDILSALATSGKQNGLNEKQRNDFTLFTSAAAVSYLCVDQKGKYKLTK